MSAATMPRAREMGFDPDREPPFFFCKPDNSIVVVPPGKTASISYPSQSTDFQHEIELVIAIGRAGSDIPIQQAEGHILATRWAWT
jgi:fumarylpyruvate hydrolase